MTWANQHTVTTPEQAATIIDGVIDTGVPIAGEGAPLVSEFALMELIAVLGRSPDGGRAYVGRIIECAWRLPNIYKSVVEGRLAPWRAERIADLTRSLNAEAAAFVDRQLAAVGGVGWAQLDRLVTEAILRFDPERAEAERQAANEDLFVDVDRQVDQHGRVRIDALVDAADGHDFDQAVNRRAIQRGKLGDDSSLDVRRARGVGDMARQDLSLDLLFADEETGEVTVQSPGRARGVGDMARQDLSLDLLFADEETGEVTVQSPGRKVVLNVHITDTTLTGSRDGRSATSSTNDENPFAKPDVNPVGRWEDKQVPISTAQIKEWLRARDTTVIVRPVVDLKDCVPVDSYEIPDRIRQRVQLRDHQCRFPGCPKQATRCDLDHATPHGQGGVTCPCNLVPLCRRHHRAKTHSRWRYVIVLPSHYLWTSPNSRHFLVGPNGTRALDPPRTVDPEA
ncbi:HNH endonuclease signature motif containing protein [Nocardioides sp. Root614]|uniref:HNH endonuclease signature motif containing protein n=1 Tax=Nocardioides sp. Root614 TaxID=1736571 RepID=UPI000702821E|nr:HNH endonuclease signature motif containing protein [Nocardioides sp. Root614]KRA38357.1 hypothetical protein ASD81_06880 [Nocardioides sp. Root614]